MRAIPRGALVGLGTGIGTAICSLCATTGLSVARADAVAYLVNVTVRPGYNFPDSAAALSYGNDICGRVAAGLSFRTLVDDVTTDFASSDEYQASYLISQAVNELCPQLIWQLRNSAAHYTGPIP